MAADLRGTVITLVLLDEEQLAPATDVVPAGELVARAVRRFENTREGEREIRNAARAATEALRDCSRQLGTAASL